jgi:hypothetical protein
MQVVATRAPVCLWGSSQQTCARRTPAAHTFGNFSARKPARCIKARHQGGLQARWWCFELRMLAPRRYSSSCVLNMPTTCHGLSSRPSKTCLPTRLHPAHALTGASFISTVTGQCARHGGMPLLSVSKLQSTPSVRTRTLEPWLQPSRASLARRWAPCAATGIWPS